MVTIPVVGEAIIRVRVIGDRLNADISRAVRQGVQGAGPDIDRAGEAAGQRWNQAFERSVRSGNARMTRAGQQSGAAVGTGARRQIDRDRPGLASRFARTATSMTTSFKDEFNLGIGAARMGPAIIGALTLAGPSILSGAGALGSAIGAQLVSQIAAAAPAIAGAGILAAAGISTLALNVGLLMAAFKAGNPELEAAVTRFKELGKVLGTPIAGGMAEGFSRFVGSLERVLPQVNDLLEDTGRAFGEVFENLGKTIERGDNLSRLRDILATNNTFVRNFGVGLSGLTTSFLILMRAAQPFIDFLGDATKRFGEWAESSLATAEANGTLASFMETLLEKTRSAGNAIKDIAVGLYNIGKAAAGAAAPMGEIAANFRAWTENPENQAKMERFFEKMHTLASGLGQLFGQLASAAGNALANMDMTNLLRIMEIIGEKWGPAIAQIFGQISEGAGDNLVTFFDNIGEALQNIADSGVMEDVARGFSKILVFVSDLIKTLSENPIGAKILAIAAGFALFGGILSPIFNLLKFLPALFTGLGGAMGLPAAVAAAVAAGFILILVASEDLRESFRALGEAIWDKLKVIWEYLEPALERLGPAVMRAAKAIGDFLAPIIRLLTPLITFVIGAIGGMIIGFINFFTLLADFVTAWLTGDWQPFIDDWLAIVAQAQEYWDNTFMPWWNELWQKVEDWAKEKWEELKAWLGQKWDEIVFWAKQKWEEFGIWLHQLWPRLITWAVLKWQEFQVWLGQLWTDILIWAQTKWGEFTTWLGNLWTVIQFAAIAAWESFKSWLFQTWIDIIAYGQMKWTEFQTWLSELWPSINVWAAQKWLEFQAWLGQLWTDVVLWGMQKWSEFQTWLAQLWPSIVTWAAVKWEEFKQWLSQKWTEVVLFGMQKWSEFQQWLAQLWPSIVTWAAVKWEEFKQWLSRLWSDIVSLARQWWETFKTTIEGIINGLVVSVQVLFGGMLGSLSAIWSGIAQAASIAWQAVYMAIIQPIQNAYDKIVELAGLIGGVISGLLGNVNADLDSVNSAVQDAVAGAAAASAAAGAAAGSAFAAAGAGGLAPNSKIEEWFGQLAGRIGDLSGSVEIPFGGALARGGTVPALPGGQLFQLGEAGRRERVEPLDSQGLSTRDRALISMLVKSMLPGGTTVGAPTVNVRIGDRIIKDIVTDVVDDRDQTLARRASSRRPQ